MSFNSPQSEPTENLVIPESNYSYQGPPHGLLAYPGPNQGAVPIPESELQTLLEFASWRQNPPFTEGGRSSFIARTAPEIFGDTKVAAYKLKGIANCDSTKQVVTPPSDEQYINNLYRNIPSRTSQQNLHLKALALMGSIVIHMGITETGQYTPILDPPKPLGGMPHGRGQAEFENAKTLVNAGVNACAPIAWGIYPELKWHNQPMEFVILSLPTSDPRRLGNCYEPDISQGYLGISSNMKEMIDKHFEMYSPDKLEIPALKFTAHVSTKIGQTLRQAHEAGICRFAGHTGNYSYMPEIKNVLMHDFDSSVKVANLAPSAILLSLIRDIESATAGMTHSIGHSHLYNLVNDPAKFLKDNPLERLINGYFANDNEECRQLAAQAAKQLGQMMIEILSKRGPMPSPHEQSLWVFNMSNQLNFAIPQLLLPVIAISNLQKQYQAPIPCDQATLVKNLKSYQYNRSKLFETEQQKRFSQLPQWAQHALRIGPGY